MDNRLRAMSVAAASIERSRRVFQPLRPPTVDDIVNSRNGGRNHKHMAAVRAARKARNVKRHRAHMKGKKHA